MAMSTKEHIHMMLILFKIFGGRGIAGRKVKSDRKVLRSAEAETHLGGDGGGIDGIIGEKTIFLLLLVNPVALNRQKAYTSCDVKGDSCFNNQQVCSNTEMSSPVNDQRTYVLAQDSKL